MLSTKQVRLFATAVIVATAAWTSPAAAADAGYRPCTENEFLNAWDAENFSCCMIGGYYSNDNPECFVDEQENEVYLVNGGCNPGGCQE